MGASYGRPTVPYSLDDSDRLTPEEHRREIASILARGILRLHQARTFTATSAPPDDAHLGSGVPDKDLEVSARSAPPCDQRLAHPRSREEDKHGA